jgi:plastocyanin
MVVAVSAWFWVACARRPLPEGGDAGGLASDATVFMAVAPCLDQGDYVRDTNTVVFDFFGTPPGFIYDPPCLAIRAGESVTFSGSFPAHPLYPSVKRGTRPGNPIGGVSTGDSKDITFQDAGFFAYYCGIHGASDDGSAMAGVVWVR